MPRAVDRRNISADNDPNRSGTETHFGKMLGSELEILRQALEAAAENLKAQVVEFIKDLTGLDLSSPDAFFASLAELVFNGPQHVEDFIQSIISQLASAFIAGGPFIEDLLRNLFGALEGLDNIPVIGDIDEAIESAFESIEKFLDAFQGIDLTGDPGAVLHAIAEAITEALEGVPVIGDIVGAITGIVNGDFDDLENWAQKVPLLNAIGGFLNGGVIPGLDASKITSGQFFEGLIPALSLFKIPNLPFSHIVGDNPLANSSFDQNLDSWTIFGGGWSHDPAVGSGAAKVVGDGNFNRDLTSEQFDVTAGDQIPISAKVRWSGFTSTAADSIQLAATLFDAGGNSVGFPVIAAIGPNGTQTGWQTISGTLTIPAGVTKYAVRLSMRSSGTGDAWFDDIAPSMPGSGLDLLSVLSNFPVIGDLVKALTGVVNGNFTDLQQWASRVPLLNLITGFLNGSTIPGLDASKIISGQFAQSMVNITNIAGNLITGLLNAANIPGIDASKIISGQFAQAFTTGLPDFMNWLRLGTRSGTNLVPDPSTSSSLLWSGSGLVGSLSSDFKVSGSASLKMTGNGTSTRASYITRSENDYYRVDVQPQQRYYFECKLTGDPANVASAGTIGIGAGFVDNTGVLVSTYPAARSIAASAVPKGTFTTLSGYLTVPAGYTLMAPRVYLNGSVPSADSYYFTEFVVREVTESQNIIQALFGGTNILSNLVAAVIPGLDASKIITGQFSQSMINLTSIAANLISGVLTPGNIPALDQTKITGLADDLGAAVANAGNALTTATGWVTAFFNGITGQTQTNVPVADAQAQAAALAETQAALAAAVAALQNTNDGGTNQGVAGIDEFDRVAGANLGGTGFWEVVHEVGTSADGNVDIHDGTQVDWHDAGNAYHRIHFRCTNPAFATTLTDYQKVTLTSGTIAAESQLPFDAGSQTWRIRVRENAAKTQYVFIEIGFTGKAQWGYRNGGAETLVGTQFDCPLPTPGSYYTVEAGLPSGVRYFRLRRNGVAIGNVYNDTGAVTALGSNNRGHGFDMQAAPRGGTGQSTPAAVGSYSVADNVPPTVIGRGLQVYRSNTAGANMAAGDQTVPNAFFDMVEASTADITWSAATSTATINATDWYTIDFNFRTSVDLSRDQALSALIYQNGAIKRRGQSLNSSVGTSSNPAGSAWAVGAPMDLSVCKSLYLTAGSTIKPGWFRTALANGSAPGNANGDFANMTIVRGKQ